MNRIVTWITSSTSTRLFQCPNHICEFSKQSIITGKKRNSQSSGSKDIGKINPPGSVASNSAVEHTGGGMDGSKSIYEDIEPIMNLHGVNNLEHMHPSNSNNSTESGYISLNASSKYPPGPPPIYDRLTSRESNVQIKYNQYDTIRLD